MLKMVWPIFLMLLLYANASFAAGDVSSFFDRADEQLQKIKPKSSSQLRDYVLKLNQEVIDLNFEVFSDTKIKREEKTKMLQEIKKRYQSYINGLFDRYDYEQDVKH